MATLETFASLPLPIFIALGIELFLIGVTVLCLTQPHTLFRKDGKTRRFAWIAGWATLGLTFCWSFILGSLLTLHGLRLWH